MPSNIVHMSGRSGSTVQHSKENALSEREFELLLEGAAELSKSSYYYKPDPQLTILLLGRLGLRRGELSHLSEDWIDWREDMISIPHSDPCTKGEDGGICGSCISLAEQRVEYNDELTLEEALEYMWVPKTEAAAREIYFGFSTRLEMFLERYFSSDEYSRYEPSSTAVTRRVKKAADLAPELDATEVHPHGLRATAATYHAARGLRTMQLMQMFGWVQPSTAERYISRNGASTARQLNAIHSR